MKLLFRVLSQWWGSLTYFSLSVFRMKAYCMCISEDILIILAFFYFFFIFFFFKMSVCLMTFQQSWKSFLQSCDYLEVSFFMWKALLYFKIDSFVIFFYTIKCNASISFSVLMKKREICFSKTETKISKNEGWNSNCLILKLLFLCLMKFSREQLKNLVEIVTAPGNSVIQIIFALSVCVYVSISSCLG